MFWLIIALTSYFFLAAVNLADKYILGDRISNPKIYTFYVGIAGIFLLILLPFGVLTMPSPAGFFLAIFAGAFDLLGIFILFIGLKKFEASRIIPAIGALLPIFTFTFVLIQNNKAITPSEIAVFILLTLGASLITWERKKVISFQSLKIAFLAAFLFAAYFITAKFVYLSQPFVSGFFWTRIGALLAAVCFLFFKDVRKDIFGVPQIAQKNNWIVVLPTQIVGGLAVVLQNWAVALAPLTYLGIVNALEGTKYVFLIIFAALISIRFPKILKEEVSRDVIFQKIIAILFIGAGLVTLAL